MISIPNEIRFPDTRIGKYTVIGREVQILGGVFIGNNCTIKDDVWIGSNVIIGHNTVIEDDVWIEYETRIQACCYITRGTRISEKVFIGPMVCTTNDNAISSHGRPAKDLEGVVIERGVRIGARTLLMPGVVIQENAFIGAGSIIKHSIPPREIWFGSPAKFVRDVNFEELI